MVRTAQVPRQVGNSQVGIYIFFYSRGRPNCLVGRPTACKFQFEAVLGNLEGRLEGSSIPTQIDKENLLWAPLQFSSLRQPRSRYIPNRGNPRARLGTQVPTQPTTQSLYSPVGSQVVVEYSQIYCISSRPMGVINKLGLLMENFYGLSYVTSQVGRQSTYLGRLG